MGEGWGGRKGERVGSREVVSDGLELLLVLLGWVDSSEFGGIEDLSSI